MVKNIHYNCSDMGNAERLIDLFGENIRYCNTAKSWYTWNNATWERDDSQKIMIFANNTVKSIYEEISQESDESRRQELAKWATRSASFQCRRNMVQSAQPLVPISSNEWNANENLFNCINGTLELNTLSFREHRKEDYLTKKAEVEYNPTVSCPLWEQHLSLVFDNDSELISAFQMICGYTLLAENPEQVFFILYGNGRNGKTVTQNVISEIFGDYATNASPDTLMAHRTSGGSPRSDIVRLDGARLITSSEGDAGDSISEKFIKQATGDDKITARGLYQNEREFKISGKIWFATNHKPVIKGTDFAIWRRVWLWPFSVTIPQDKRDIHMKDKLTEEKSGILNWMLSGLKNYYDNGSKLIKPLKVQIATDEYKTESNPIANFIKDCCLFNPEDPCCKVMRQDLYSAYEIWIKDTGEDCVTKKTFASLMQEYGVKKLDNGRRWWGGIQLKATIDDEGEDLTLICDDAQVE